MASLPFDGTFVKASIELRRTEPRAVAKSTCRPAHSPSSSGSGNTVAMVSSGSNPGSRLTTGRPLVAGPPSGSRQTLRRNTRPAVVKNSTGVWVEVTNSSVTASSSLVCHAGPALAAPPLGAEGVECCPLDVAVDA